MTSKNSFLARIIENNKRRIWIWVVSAFGFMVALPTAVAMTISREMSRVNNYYFEVFGSDLGKQKLQEVLFRDMEWSLGVENDAVMLCIAAAAVISAIQGFSYLYSKRKIDFYMGMPVKRKRRFFIIWLNGIFVYLIPYLLGLIISGLIALSNGAVNGEVLKEMGIAFGLFTCFYLGVYHLTILAVMMTGNVIITCFGTAVFFLYELMVRSIIEGYMSEFYKFYSYFGVSTSPVLSPFSMLWNYRGDNGNPWLTACYLLLFAAVVGVLAYIGYLKRPAEAAGKAMAFTFPAPFIKILITIPVTLMAGLMTADIVGYVPLYGNHGIGFVFFAMAIVLLVSSCLIQVLYEFDIKGILHKKHHILISAAAVAVIFCIFRFDLLGYDSYIPPADKVVSTALIPPEDYYSYYGNNYFNEELEMVSSMDYANDTMYLTDVGAVNKLMKLSMDAINEVGSLEQMYADEERNWKQVQVIYRLNNKQEVYRKMYVDIADPEIVELLDRIESSEEFIIGSYLGASDILDKAVMNEENKLELTYGNGIYETRMKREEAEELLTLYKEDIKDTGFKKIRESIPTGALILSFEKQYKNYSTTQQACIRIYPFFDKSIAYLKEKGYYMDYHLNPEDVERIQITNFNYEATEAMEKEQMTQSVPSTAGERMAVAEYAGSSRWYGRSDDFTRYVTYEDSEAIQTISEKLYPRDWIQESWHMDAKRAESYAVTVYFKQGTEAMGAYGGVAEYCFTKDEVPDFIKEATAYEKQ